jgi:6-pyruvoyltetrahydropterin/6-carboxytetrahydropterin synthase
MAKITCTRRIQFCAGHRVMGHENKCANLHGHNWVALITAEADALDSVGRIVDFSVLKERYGRWIDDRWDHGMILRLEDPWALVIENASEAVDPGRSAFRDLKTKLFLMEANPTSENLARFLLDSGVDLMKGTGVTIVKVRLYETENCYSDATL